MGKAWKNLILVSAGAAIVLAGVWFTRRPVDPGQAPFSAADLHTLHERFRVLNQRLAPSVVTVNVRGTIQASPEGPPVRRNGSGSGFVIEESGLIVTNEHVIRQAEEITVTLSDGRLLPASVVGLDVRSDLAILKVPASLPSLKMGQAELVREGDWVAAIGNPLGTASLDGRSSFTTGMVSKRDVTLTGLGTVDGHRYVDMIQTTASIAEGSSGGPLVDLEGRVIGIITDAGRGVRKLPEQDVAGTVDSAGYAIPMNHRIQRAIHQLVAGERVQYGWIGLNVGLAGRADLAGLTVASVERGSPAERAGLAVGDVVTHLDGKAADNSQQFQAQIEDSSIGRRIELTIIRDGRPVVVPVEIGDYGNDLSYALSSSQYTWRGMQVETFVYGGVLVLDIEPGSPAELAGLTLGSVVIRVDDDDIRDAIQFRNLVAYQAGPVKLTMTSQHTCTVPEP